MTNREDCDEVSYLCGPHNKARQTAGQIETLLDGGYHRHDIGSDGSVDEGVDTKEEDENVYIFTRFADAIGKSFSSWGHLNVCLQIVDTSLSVGVRSHFCGA